MINSLAAVTETGKTIRYSLSSNARTARLTVLMLIAVISWHLLL
ncbi:hypothetical protein Ahu01nite_094260 [Winogradskya humida]|uniref:Uncharacterized protein n=1 Tax=Winogradskya humida TaxID=113566 RepID=A0ABQ4A665_9ACTN|nr:hypothetical protein Ahu01nite_094260 [Actinoplanes humidus]